MRLQLFLLTFCLKLCAEVDYSNLTTYCDSQAILNNHMAVITGQFIDRRNDLLLAGKEPIFFSSSFTAPLRSLNTPHGSFFVMPHLHAEHDEGWNGLFGTEAYIKIQDDHGSKLRFVSRNTSKKHLAIDFNIMITIGMANTFKGEPSGQTNPLNTRVRYYPRDKHIKVIFGDGTERIYGQRYCYKKFATFNRYRYDLIKEKLRNGCLRYYKYDEHRRICQITSTNPLATKIYGSAWFHYPTDNKNFESSDFQITTSHGKKHKYTFQIYCKPKSKENKIKLKFNRYKEVIPAYGLRQVYYWKQKGPGEPLYPEGIDYYAGRTIHFHQFESGPSAQKERLSAISGPIGNHGSEGTIQSISYDLGQLSDEGWSRDGYTEVRDPYQQRTTYHFNQKFDLTHINRFKREGNRDILASSEHFCWEEKDYLKLLKCKYITEGPSKNGILSTHYAYDARGNIIETTQFGHFTGQNKNPMQLDTSGVPNNNAEKRITRKTYTEDGTNRLLKVIHPDQTSETFAYRGDTHLVTLHLIYDREQKIIHRSHFTYNSDHVLIKQIEDDGNSPDIDTLSQVHLCKITRITPTAKDPGIDFPHIITENAYDQKTGRELLLKKTILFYTLEGWITKKEIYDANNQLCYALHYKYNDKGWLLYETDPLGHETQYTYDHIGNKTSTIHLQQCTMQTMHYDKANRLVHETIQAANETRPSYYLYNANSKKIAERNYLGLETRYEYDSLGNLIKTISPPFLSKQNTLISKIQSASYNAFQHPLSKSDSFGSTTHLTYNSLGKVTQEIAVDGAITQTIYNPDQTEAKKILPNGTVVLTEYDAAKRPLKVSTYDSSGQSLTCKTFLYEGSLLVQEIDEEGIATTYHYDAAGRVIEKSKDKTKTTFEYDSLGRLCCETQHPSSNPSEAIQTYTIRDHLDRIIEEKTVCNTITTHHTKTYYDIYGNVALKTTMTNQATLCEKWEYDPFGRLLTHTDAQGAITRYAYREVPFQNGKPTAQAQHISGFSDFKAKPATIYVNEVTQISPKGVKTVRLHNEVGLIISDITYDPLDQILRQETFAYDAEYRKIEQKSTIIFNNEPIEQHTTSWEYDVKGNIAKIQEGSHLASPRITCMQYTFDDQISKQTKPSGVTISYAYDALSRLISIISSDKTVHYSLTYDKKGRRTQTFDHIHNTTSLITYDVCDNPISETLGNGLVIERTYDALHRKTSLTLPDQSQVFYTYQGVFLSTIRRNDQIHCFDQYDTSGLCLKESPMYQLPMSTYTYDTAGRPIKASHSNLSHVIESYDPEGLVLKSTIHTFLGDYSAEFTYDALNQLSQETGYITHSYHFDSHHSLRSRDAHTTHIAPMHQLTSLNDLTITYDANGNRATLSKATQSFEYRYDALDRLIEIKTPCKTLTYTYDSEHRCLSQTITPHHGPSTTLYLIYDGQCEIGSYLNNAPHELRILGATPYAEIGSAVLLELDNKPYVPLHDLFGNITMLIDPTTQCEPEHYIYSAFGELSLKTPPISPYTYQSKRHCPYTGLIQFGRRFYDPTIGAFINPDPKGLDAIPNPYTYLYNNPLLHHDPWGLEE
ncbi:MAG: hypothetical protein K9M07_06235, partial [Simkaniaceae bacterium]|nr:hypothetical protein [Simkaniaceae bacterium]